MDSKQSQVFVATNPMKYGMDKMTARNLSRLDSERRAALLAQYEADDPEQAAHIKYHLQTSFGITA